MSPYKDPEKNRQRNRTARQTPEYKAMFAEYYKGYREKNREALKAKSRAYYEANKDELNAKQRVIALRNCYELTEERYNEMLAAQDYRCAICFTDDPGTSKGGWLVDHNHSCCAGKKSCGECVRGLLCRSCNSGIGYLRDNVLLLQSAIDYLNRAQ